MPRVELVTRKFDWQARTGLKSIVSEVRVILTWLWGVENGAAWDRKSRSSDEKNEGKGQSHYADRRSVSSTVEVVVRLHHNSDLARTRRNVLTHCNAATE